MRNQRGHISDVYILSTLDRLLYSVWDSEGGPLAGRMPLSGGELTGNNVKSGDGCFIFFDFLRILFLPDQSLIA